MQLKDVVEEYLLEMSIQNFSENTIRVKGYNYKKFIELVGEDMEMEDLKKIHFTKYIIEERQRGCKISTINQRLKHLRSFFNYCLMEDQGYLKVHPMKGVQNLKEEKNMIKTYSDNDIKKILESVKDKDFLSVRNKTIITLFLETGIRNTELCKIKLEDISSNSIRIHGKGDKYRYVPLTKHLEKQLRIYMRVRTEKFKKAKKAENNLLFISRFFDPMNRYSVLKMVKTLSVNLSLGVDVNIHNFRHYYAQKMLDVTKDVYTVSKLLGHSQVTTTENYLRGIENLKLIETGMNSPLSNL